MGRDRFGLAMHLLLVEWRGWTAQMINFLTGIALAASPLAVRNGPWAKFFDGVIATMKLTAAPSPPSLNITRF
jgi:hypothetical protein